MSFMAIVSSKKSGLHTQGEIFLVRKFRSRKCLSSFIASVSEKHHAQALKNYLQLSVDMQVNYADTCNKCQQNIYFLLHSTKYDCRVNFTFKENAPWCDKDVMMSWIRQRWAPTCHGNVMLVLEIQK